MHTEVLSRLSDTKLHQWHALLKENDLHPVTEPEQIVLVWDGDRLVATGAREGYLLKYIAVHHEWHGEDLTATVLTLLRREAFVAGHRHLLLYTKPHNEAIFSSLLFHPVARTGDVLLMEEQRNGIHKFLSTLPTETDAKTVGAIVMNADPFTLGHQHLIKTAACECDRVYVFVLSEDRGCFSADDRLQMVRRGTENIRNVTVLPTGPYLVSAATFPTYFLKDRDNAASAHCALDITVFCEYFVPYFAITHRYLGEEPHSPLTAKYNEALKTALPARGIIVREIKRRDVDGQPISASAVRRLLRNGDVSSVRSLVPKTTLDYIIGR